MPIVRTSLAIPDVSLLKVWDAISDFESFPATMDNVVSVDFLEKEGNTALSSWTVLLSGSELNWTERDIFEPQHRISFDSVEGDLEVFRGQWLLRSLNRGVEVEFDVEFDLGIPSLSEVLDPIGVEALEINSRNMLLAIGRVVS